MRTQLGCALSDIEAANADLELRVRTRTRQLRELVGRVLTAQEDERRRVALELHDETAQALTALTMALDSVSRGGDQMTPERAETLREARQMASTTLEGVHRLIKAPGPAALDTWALTTPSVPTPMSSSGIPASMCTSMLPAPRKDCLSTSNSRFIASGRKA